MPAKSISLIDKAREELSNLSKKRQTGVISDKEFNFLKLPYLATLGTRKWYNDDGTMK